MANIAVQLTIGNYEEWRPMFDKHKHLRDEAGIRPCLSREKSMLNTAQHKSELTSFSRLRPVMPGTGEMPVASAAWHFAT
jgi:hypothetical protein